VAEITLPALDGYPLAADLFEPPEPAGVALLGPAMATPRRFYRPFAEHLAAAGVAVLVVDYRGVGGSAPARLRGFRATLLDWADRDLAGGAAFLRARHPGLPLAWVGHSIGGQLLGVVREVPVTAALLVAAQSGHWRHWPRAWQRAAMFSFWWAGVPALTAAFGRLPMRLLRQGVDVPAGAARQWARWGRHPDYAWSHARAHGGLNFARYAGPLRAYAPSDDGFAPLAAHQALLRHYAATRPELRVVHPRDVGARRIGHFGFFRPAFRETLWAEATEWLLGSMALPRRRAAR
jgi:predicted alpha/beta hydrolase